TDKEKEKKIFEEEPPEILTGGVKREITLGFEEEEIEDWEKLFIQMDQILEEMKTDHQRKQPIIVNELIQTLESTQQVFQKGVHDAQKTFSNLLEYLQAVEKEVRKIEDESDSDSAYDTCEEILDDYYSEEE
ncbi:3085_t:CDS:1, partial [Ambispora gerdemannii]